jgi:hypothetical protein
MGGSLFSGLCFIEIRGSLFSGLCLIEIEGSLFSGLRSLVLGLRSLFYRHHTFSATYMWVSQHLRNFVLSGEGCFEK